MRIGIESKKHGEKKIKIKTTEKIKCNGIRRAAKGSRVREREREKNRKANRITKTSEQSLIHFGCSIDCSEEIAWYISQEGECKSGKKE